MDDGSRKDHEYPKEKKDGDKLCCNWFASVRISVKHKGQATYLKKPYVNLRLALTFSKPQKIRGRVVALRFVVP